MSRTLTIAIPARHEPTILETLIHLANAVKKLPPDVAVETIVCVNGHEDQTGALAQQLVGQGYGRVLDLSIIESAPGKIVALKEIIKRRKYNGPLISHDADVIVNIDGIASLYSTLERQQQLDKAAIVYAQCVPIVDLDFCSPLQRFYNDVYTARYLHLSCRPWAHGRINGMTTKTLALTFGNSNMRARVATASSHPLAEKLALHKGPIVDDILSSRVVHHVSGHGSIVKVPSARVAFVPPFSVQELFLSIRRATIELARLDILFPEHAPVQRQFEAQVALSDAEIFGRIHKEGTAPAELMRLDFAHRLEEAFTAFVRSNELGIHPATPLTDQVQRLIKHPAMVEEHGRPSEESLAIELGDFLYKLMHHYSEVAATEKKSHWIELAGTKRAKIELGVGQFWHSISDAFAVRHTHAAHPETNVYGAASFLRMEI